MTNRPSLSQPSLPRLFVLGGIAVIGAVLATSCLTPDATFSDTGNNANVGGSGGDGDGDGDLVDHCTNRTLDADETDTDCGGRDCEPCALGRTCEAGSDCVNGTCTEGQCQMPSCTDGVKNSSETDVDCGGDGCPPCGDGEVCENNVDCESASCRGGECAEATCNDRIENGNESDVDCGGDCSPCESGSKCVLTMDCVQPPAEDPSTTVCEDGQCTLLCATGLGDCNQQAGDGCETNLNTDTTHCGACGDSCSPDHAVGECLAGTCLIKRDEPDGGCLGNWRDCNSMDEDGCEANINNNADHCGACDAACSDANGTPSCSGGTCSIECEDGFDDCDINARDNGCEIDLNASVLHCGTCDNVCTPNPGESASCDTSLSGDPCTSVACDAPSDCGGFSPCGACDNSMCNDRLDDISNCGGCGIVCDVAHGTPNCTDPGGGYECGVATCDSSGGQAWQDCDASYVNGCEVDTNSNKFRCGGCLNSDPGGSGGEDCTDIESNGSMHVTATECSSGGCRIVGCDTGYADCNGVFSDGCEVNTVTNDTHCGGCTSGPTTTWDGGFVCDDLYDNGSGSCSGSVCEFDDCDTDYGDCNGDATLGQAGDGCEEFLVGNDEHCGTCGNECITNAATSGNACTASGNRACNPTCANPSNNGNCDGNGANGCETQLQVSEMHCGTCGNNCNDDIGSNNISGVDCASGGCEVLTCNNNRADCDGDFGDGCEVNTNTSETHCGGCTSGPTTTWDGGTNCNNAVGSNNIAGVNCDSGDCEVSTCNSNRADCDGTFSNGCEVNTNNSITHCGGCTSGPTTTWDGGESCASKSNANRSCNTGNCFWTCQTGWKDSNGDLQSGGSNGCETAIIGVVNTSDTGTGDTNGDLSFSHTLETSRSSNNKRAIVLLVGNKANNVGLPPPVTYDGSSMTLAVNEYNNQSFAAIYYILDADMPTNAKTATVSIDGNQFNSQDWTAHVIELTNVDQSSPLGGTADQGAGGSSCNADDTVATNADAFVVTLLNTASNDNFTATSGQTELAELSSGPANTIAGYWEEVGAGTRRATWNCSVSQWSHVMASFNPEGTD